MNWFQSFLQRLVPQKRARFFNESNAARPSHRVPDVGTVVSAIRQAEAGRTVELFGLYRDALMDDLDIQTAMETRKLAVLGTEPTVLPWDENDLADVDAAKRIEDLLADTPDITRAKNVLLDGAIWPVAVVKKTFAPVGLTLAGGGSVGQRYRLEALSRINPALLDWSAPAECDLPAGRMRIGCVGEDGGMKGHFEEVSPAEFIVHRGHLLTVADNWGGPMRCILFWWLLANCDLDWWSRFLEKYGAPFPVGKYEAGNEEEERTLQRAFAAAVRIGGLVVSQGTEVELMQAAAGASGDAFSSFHETCRRQIQRRILGQTMTSEGQAQGIGGSQAQVHEGVRQDFRQWDQVALGATLRDQLFRQYLRINGWPGRAPKLSWGVVDDKEAAINGTLLQALYQAGIELTDEGISQISKKLEMDLQRVAAASPSDAAANFAARLIARSGAVGGAQANAAVVRSATPQLARAMREAFADVPRLLRESRSPAEFQRRLSAASISDGDAVTLLTAALVATAGNGCSRDH